MEAYFIRFLRKNKKITQEELAESIGVSRRTIINWENCRKKISKKNKEKVKMVFKLKNNIKINRENLTEKWVSYKEI